MGVSRDANGDGRCELMLEQAVDQRVESNAANLSAGSSRTTPVEKGIRLGRIHIRDLKAG